MITYKHIYSILLLFIGIQSVHAQDSIIYEMQQHRNSQGLFGRSIAGLNGDANLDGYYDFAVSSAAQITGNANQYTGRVYLGSGKTGKIIRTLKHPNDLSFGICIHSFEDDWNKDGSTDLIIGSDQTVYVYNSNDGKVLAKFDAPNGEKDWGHMIAHASDLDGDKKRDIALNTKNGLYLISSKTGDIIYHSKLSGTTWSNTNIGRTLANIGDINEDGFDELAVSRKNAAGKHLVFVCNGQTGKLLHILSSPSSDPLKDYYGMAIAPIRDDIDDDDIVDFLVAAPRAAQGGIVYAISGKDMKVIHSMKSPQNQSNIDFGASLDAIADRDGDCVDDFVISDRSGLDSGKNPYDQTRGRIHIFSGKTGELIRSISPPQSHDRIQFASPVASARADLNQDGVSDILTTCDIEKYGRGHGDNPARLYVFSENDALPPLEILPEGEIWFDPHSADPEPVVLRATTYPTEQIYEWYWNGERILGADKPNLEIGAAGRYTVRIPMECKDALQAYTDVQAVEDPMSGGTTDIFLGRQIHVDTVIEVKNKQIEVLVWDDKQEDGDIIALNVNGKWLLKAHELTWAQKAVEIDLNRDKDNIFIMFALNQGSIPPNTAAISIRDGKETHFFTMRSDFRGSGAIKFVYKPDK